LTLRHLLQHLSINGEHISKCMRTIIHISALPGDYYQFDAARQRLTRTGKSYKLGGKLAVQVVRVDLDEKKIDLELVGADNAKGKKGAASVKSKAKSKAKSKVGGKGKKPAADSKDKKPSNKKRKTGLRRHSK
jgi:ribonuclease R